MISSLLIRLGVSEGSVARGFKKASDQVDHFERKVNQSSAALNRIGKAGTSFGIGPGIVAATGSLISFTASAAPALNVVLALPAALAQVGAAGATLKLGMSGVNDAIGSVADGSASAKEDLAKLTPEARRFASVTGNAIKGLRASVQTALFAGWTKDFEQLAKQQSPALSRGFHGIATELGGVAKAAIATAGTPLVTGTIAEVFAATASSTHALAGATPNLISGLAAVVKVGNPVVTTFVDSAIAALSAKAAWLASADGMAWMSAKLDQGRVTMGKLNEILLNVLGTVLNVFGHARMSTGDLLGRLVELTEQMQQWTASAEGQDKIISFFDRARLLGTQIAEAFGRVVDVAIRLAEGFNKLPEPMQAGILTVSAYAIVLGPLISRFSSLIAIMLQIGAVAVKASVGILRFLFVNKLAAGGTRAAWVATRIQVLAIWLQLQAAAIASATRTAAAWAVMRVQIAAIWLQLQAAALASSARIAAAWVASWVAQRAAALASMAATTAVVVGAWIKMAAQSLLQAGRMALAWFIAMGPIGWVIAGVIALVALIIANWDTVVEWTKKAWGWVWSKGIKPAVDFAMAIINRFVSDVKSVWNFFVTTLPNIIRSGFSQVNSTISEKISGIIGFFTSLPGKIWDAISGFNSRMHQWGIDLVQGMINGLGDAVGRLVAKAREVASAAMNAIKGALGIGSPSKITHKWMVWVGEGGVRGGEKMVRPLERTGERMADAAMRPWNALGRTAPFALDQQISAPRPSFRGFDDGDGSDPRGGPGGALLNIEHFHAGSQTPDETANALEYARRRR